MQGGSRQEHDGPRSYVAIIREVGRRRALPRIAAVPERAGVWPGARNVGALFHRVRIAATAMLPQRSGAMVVFVAL